MDVGCQRIHANHFRVFRADNFGHGRCQKFVVAVPGVGRMKMPFNAILCPLVEFQLNGCTNRLRLQPERVACEIHEFARTQRRKMESVTIRAQRVRLVLCPGVFDRWLILHARRPPLAES